MIAVRTDSTVSSPRTGSIWRKARLAARLLQQGEHRPLSSQRARIAAQLANDPEISNRLIQHGIDWLDGRKFEKTQGAGGR